MSKTWVFLVFTIFLMACGHCDDADNVECGDNEEPKDDPDDCGANEVPKDNPDDCVADCCPVGDNAPCPNPCPPGPCRCNVMSRRAENGTCIPTRECPPYDCGDNEVYDPCPNTFCSEKCSNASPSGKRCRFVGRIGITNICNPKCCCKPYYWRDNSGRCVTYEECSLCQENANGE